MIRAGIIGLGKMGRIREQAITQSGLAAVVATYDSDSRTGSSGAIRASSAESLIRSPEVDAVFICTPNHLNLPLTLESLRAEKHVFCEKPPAFTAAEVADIREVERSTDRVLMYGFNHRHHESIQRMKAIVDSGEMGRVLWMRGRYGKEVDERFFEGWRARKELAGGGIMLDQGIHMLDLMLYLGGGFDEVQAMVSNLHWKLDGIEDNVFVNLRSSETGVCASLHSTMTQWRHLFSLEVFLESGAMVLNGLKTSSGAYGDEDLSVKRNPPRNHRGTFASEERYTFHTDTSWASETCHFLECIAEGRSPALGNSADALVVMTMIDAIYGR
jgi:1,5-anhydro-D-fructose reductase (1,5-anhydro-D-mannitol-forming)